MLSCIAGGSNGFVVGWYFYIPGYMTRKKTNSLSSVKSPQMTGTFGEVLFYTSDG